MRVVCSKFRAFAKCWYKIKAKENDEGALRWCCLAYAQGYPDDEIKDIASAAFKNDHMYAILVLFDKFKKEDRNKLTKYLESQDLFYSTKYDPWEISYDQLKDSIKAVSEVPAQDREAFVKYCKDLTLMSPYRGNLHGFEIYNIIQAVSKVLAQDREDVVKHCQTLLSATIMASIAGLDLCAVIKAVSEVPAQDRETFVKLCQTLISKDMRIYDIVRIVEAVSIVPAQDREAFVKLCQTIIPEKMYGMQRTYAIKTVSKMLLAQDREAFVKHREAFVKLCSPHVRENEWLSNRSSYLWCKQEILQHRIEKLLSSRVQP